MREHDTFERLAGALALGEATPAERATFDAHAAGCRACRADAESAPAILNALAASRDEESWRPAFEDAVVRRIGIARARRSTFTFAALAWAVAISLVLNVAVVTGFSARVAGALQQAAPYDIIASGQRR